MPANTQPAITDQWIEKFLQHLGTDRGASTYTQRNYRQALLEFHRWHRDERQQPLKGFRLVQPRLVRAEDVKRFRKLGLIAEINPGALAFQSRRAEDLLGKDRVRTVSPFKSLLGGGALLAFGSEWPGTAAVPYSVKPQILIHAAVTRRGPDGLPEGGWIPEERLSRITFAEE